MKTLIIGGTGFIGRRVAACLAQQGCQVVVVHRGRTETPTLSGAVCIRANYKDPIAIAAIVREFSVEVIIDLVAMTAEQTAPLLDALRGSIARYVLVSSIDVYKAFGALRRRETVERKEVPLAEEAPLRESRFPYRDEQRREPGTDPFDYYDKIPIEELVRRQSDFRWTILRLPFVYGPEDHQQRFSSFIWRIFERRLRLPLETKTAHWKATYDYVINTASAIALAATHSDAADQVFNLGEEKAYSQREWAAELCQSLRGSTEVHEVDATHCPPHLLRFARMFDPEVPLIVDSNRLRTCLGYKEKVTREDALQATIDACLKAGRPRGLWREYRDEDRMIPA